MIRTEISERDVAFSAILETIVDGIVIADAAGAIVLTNRAAEAILGRRGADVMGLPLDGAVPGLEAPVRQLREGAVVRGLELRYPRPGGETRALLVNGAPMRGEHGALTGLVVTFADVTERMRTFAQLEASERRFRELTEQSADIIGYVSLDGKILYVSPAARTILGYAPEEMIGRASQDFVHPDDRAILAGTVDVSPADVFTAEFRARRKDGSLCWLDTARRVVRDASDTAVGFLVISRDVTERRAAAEMLQRTADALALAQEIAHVGSFQHDVAGGTASWSDELYRIYGVSPETFAVRTDSLWHFDHPDDTAAVRHAVDAARRDRTVYEVEHRIIRPDGTERWVVERGRYTYDDAGAPVAIAGTVLDTTDRKRAEERATHLAHHDALTGLPNRIELAEALQRSIGAAGRRGVRVAVLCIDMDRFTRINDTLGHVAGDAVLKALAERIRGCLGPGDLLSRTAGDEFFAVLPDIERVEDAARIAERIVSAVAHPLEIAGRTLVVTAGIGASVYPNDGREADQLMRNAEAAMYRAKREGRGAVAFAEPELHARARKRLMIEHELRDAVENDELRLHYQPLVDVPTGAIVGCEALVRWQHPTQGMLHPDTFIGLAEESGLITSLGAWVIEEACKAVYAWTQIARPFTLAFNISARQLQHGELVATIDRLIRRYRCPPQSVEMEITETTAMRDAERALRILGEIKARNIKIGIDDFGTGYSSLAYLKRFPLDKLKIDRSFVRDLISQNGRAIVAAIISLAHSLGLVAVAEGVETEEQRALLSDLRCDQMQGYLFSPPVPAQTFETLLRSGKRYP